MRPHLSVNLSMHDEEKLDSPAVRNMPDELIPEPAFTGIKSLAKPIVTEGASRYDLARFEEIILSVNLMCLPNVLAMEIKDERFSYITIEQPLMFESLVTLLHSPLKLTFAKILLKLCNGLTMLRSLNVIHGNLKPSNILFDKDGVLKLSDYCINSIRDITLLPLSYYNYLTPEQLFQKEINHYSDIWSVGCIIYYLLYEKNIFEGQSYKEIKESIKNCEKLKLKGDDIFVKLIRKCLKIDYRKRISMSELVKTIETMTFSARIELKAEISKQDIQQLQLQLLNNPNKFVFDNLFLCFANNVYITSEQYAMINKCNNRFYINQIIAAYNIFKTTSKYLIYLINIILIHPKNSLIKYITDRFIRHIQIRNAFNELTKIDTFLLNGLYENKIDIHDIHIGSNGVKFIVDNFSIFRNLKILNIKNIGLVAGDVKLLFDNIHLIPSLEILLIKDRIGDEGMKYLSENMKYLIHKPEDEQEIIDDNDISNKNEELIVDLSDMQMSNEGIKYVANNLSSLEFVHRINISNNNNISDDGLMYFSERCTILKAIKELNFEFLTISDVSLSSMKQLLDDLPTLRRTSLKFTSFTDAGIKFLHLIYPNVKFD